MSQVYHFLNKPPVKREFFKSCMNKRTKKQNDWHCFNNHSNTFRSVVVTKKHEKTIYTGRLTWNLQINHLERKMIFQTSMIMFPVNLQGCNTNVFFGDAPFPKTRGTCHLPNSINQRRPDRHWKHCCRRVT